MQKQNIEVSIIIVNYNTKELTKSCLESVFENTKDISFEVIVVDNNSHDGSLEMLNNDPRIVLIESRTNLGFGRANNLGYEYSKGQFLFFLNSDTLIRNNAVKKFYDQMMAFPEYIACLGCMLKDANLNLASSYGNFPIWYDEFFNRQKKRLMQADVMKSLPAIVDYVCGADMFIRRSVVEKYGLFDPDFFLYFEETEMQRRYFKNGYKSVIIDGPDICHLEGGSGNNVAWKTTVFTKSLFLYMKKDLSKTKYYIFRFMIFFKRFIFLWIKPWKWSDKYMYIKVLIS